MIPAPKLSRFTSPLTRIQQKSKPRASTPRNAHSKRECFADFVAFETLAAIRESAQELEKLMLENSGDASAGHAPIMER